MTFFPNSEAIAKFSLSKSSFTFTCHEELDEFVIGLENVDPRFQMNHSQEWILLKSFDRAFWLRYLRSPTFAKYRPKRENVRGGERLSCPFGDPTLTSFVVND